MEQQDLNRAGIDANAIDEVARRLEAVCESLRAEIGRDVEAEWTGLGAQGAGRLPGAESTRRLARDLGDAAQVADGGHALVLAFVLRQLEVALSLLSRAAGEIVELKDRMTALERDMYVGSSLPDRALAPNEAL